jgi:hypothetical protein
MGYYFSKKMISFEKQLSDAILELVHSCQLVTMNPAAPDGASCAADLYLKNTINLLSRRASEEALRRGSIVRMSFMVP